MLVSLNNVVSEKFGGISFFVDNLVILLKTNKIWWCPNNLVSSFRIKFEREIEIANIINATQIGSSENVISRCLRRTMLCLNHNTHSIEFPDINKQIVFLLYNTKIMKFSEAKPAKNVGMAA